MMKFRDRSLLLAGVIFMDEAFQTRANDRNQAIIGPQ